MLVDGVVIVLIMKIALFSKFQKSVTLRGSYTKSEVLARNSHLVFPLSLHFFRAVWSLAKVQDHCGLLIMYGWDLHAMTVMDGPSTTATQAQKAVWYSTTWQLMPPLLYPSYCRPSKNRGGCQGKLFLTSTLPDSLHSTQARHSGLRGCNPPSPGLTNNSKNRKSER